MSIALEALEKAAGALRELFELKAIVGQVAEQVREFKHDMRGQQVAYERRIEDRLERLERRLDDVHRIAINTEAKCNEAVVKAFALILDRDPEQLRPHGTGAISALRPASKESNHGT